MQQKPLIIPVFMPQEGCQHRCVYCDQATISGVSHPAWSTRSIRNHVKRYLGGSSRYPVQVAFYGGSFTLLPEASQRRFLESVQHFLKRDRVDSIRLSTRPDGIETNNLRFLQSLGVKTVELGAQSLCDRVLCASARGHSSAQVYEAALLLKQHGFEWGLQLMPGLPGDSLETFCQTVEKSITLSPDFVRLYPTVVLAGTPLERLYRLGSYRPLSLPTAVAWCKEAKNRFDRAAVPIIRMGLQPTASLDRSGRIVAGPHHPAFGQLVKSAIWYDRISPALERARRRSQNLIIHAPPSDLADIRGHRNANIKEWVDTLQLASLQTTSCARTGSENFTVAAQQ